MAKKRFSPEQIVTLLRQIELATAQGKSVSVACREARISDQSYFRWRKEYGGLDLDQARKMKDLERENARLKRLVADLSLEKQILKDISSGNLPRTAPAGGGPRSGEVSSLRAPSLPDRRPAAGHATVCGDRAGRRGFAHPNDHRARKPIRPSWLPPDHDAAQGVGVACGHGSGPAHLAPGGAESSEETEAKAPLMAQRRILHKPAAGAP